MNTIARLARPVLVASLSVAAVVGATMLPAQAAPTPTPAPASSAPASTAPASTAPASTAPASTTPKASSTPATSTSPAAPTVASSASPSATSSTTPAATPSRTAKARALAGSVSAPTSPDGAVTGHFTGAAPGSTITLNVGSEGGHQPFMASGTVGADGTVSLSVGGTRWASATTFSWWASDGTETVRGGFTTPTWSGVDGTMAASVAAPSGPQAPAVVTVTGATPGADVTVVVTMSEGFTGEGGGQGTGRADSDGRAVVSIAAPQGGWVAGTTYLVSANDSAGHGSGQFPLTRFTMAGQQPASARFDVQVKAPKGVHDKVTFVFTGLKAGEWVDGVGHPVGWTKEAPYIIEVQGEADGSVTLTQDAPTEGWPVGKEYVFTFTRQDGAKVTRSFTVRAGGSDAKAPAQADKSSKGGLARTGR